ncbi:MAG TPA: hemerythrin domain-containing protein [Syntrophales bacterium]|nr:hemerythrin domain-containing protein [Syntrophales bacterium]HPL67548.1 hemerythrin domain-containing protein [Smithellaceae bacterium]HPN08840.1 hemerythrin domain-containing protein [Syntrophales bacterium]HPX81559.1 hemerythrin domain-containing protein [Syntrophales bacterium]HQB13448.1 hemerythrin domain-containing protein [Syntrophales bacterium]
MKPTEELAHEHKVIQHVLKTAAAEARSIHDREIVRTALMRMMLDFFRNFTDKCHHAKEEQHLFPMLEKRGMAHDAGPIAVMLAEHAEGRRRLADIAELLPTAGEGDREAVLAIMENLMAYVDLLEGHISKENNVLFPMAERLLGETDMEELEKAFALVEEIETGEGVHEKYHRLAHEIAGYA